MQNIDKRVSNKLSDQIFEIISDMIEPKLVIPAQKISMLEYPPNPFNEESEEIRMLAYYLYDHSKELFGVENYDTIQKRKEE